MDENTPHDPMPALMARVDQLIAEAPEVARMARAACEAHVDQGFTSAQALYLTAAQLGWNPGVAP